MHANNHEQNNGSLSECVGYLKLAVEVKELQNKLQKEAIKLRSSYPQKRGA